MGWNLTNPMKEVKCVLTSHVSGSGFEPGPPKARSASDCGEAGGALRAPSSVSSFIHRRKSHLRPGCRGRRPCVGSTSYPTYGPAPRDGDAHAHPSVKAAFAFVGGPRCAPSSESSSPSQPSTSSGYSPTGSSDGQRLPQLRPRTTHTHRRHREQARTGDNTLAGQPLALHRARVDAPTAMPLRDLHHSTTLRLLPHQVPYTGGPHMAHKDRRNTTARGMGHAHQQRRRALLPNAYGTNCPICGDLMVQGQPLDLDHSDPKLKVMGLPGDRVAHAYCNRSRGNGTNTQPKVNGTVNSREW